MLEISIKHTLDKAIKSLDRLQRELIPAATAAALNRTAATVRTEATRDIAQRTGLKVSYIREKLSIVKATRLGLTAIVKANRKGINLIEFVDPGKRNTTSFRKRDKQGAFKSKGVTAKAWGRRTEYKGTFIGTGKGSGKALVFARTGSGRNAKLKTIHGPSIPQTFINKVVVQHMKEVIEREFGKNFSHELKWRMEKQSVRT